MTSVGIHDYNPNHPGDLEQTPESVRDRMRHRALTDSFYLATTVLGYDKLTPNTHGPLCTFLDQCMAMRRLIQMPRSHFKSTCVTVVKRLQDVLQDPALRVLIVGDTAPNAAKHMAKIRNHLEGNRLLRWLFPERVWDDTGRATSWSQFQLFLPQDINGTLASHGEPTFDVIGAGGAVVSRHYNIINADDLIGEDEFYSETEMSKVIDWFSNLEALFVPPMTESLMDIPSTYWRTDDVYAFAEDFYGKGQQPVKTGPFSYQRGDIAVFRRGAVEDGVPIFPETRDATGRITNGFPIGFFERLREKNPERYAAQYANNPKSSENAYFQDNYLRYYEVRDEQGDILSVDRGSGIVEIVHTDALPKYLLCDPHAGGSGSKFRGGRAAVLTTAVDIRYPRIYILDAWIRRAPTNLIIDEIIRQNEKWDPEVASIEANGLQKMLKYWLEERMEREAIKPIPYVPFIPRGDKDGERRIKGLQPLFKAGQIFLQRGMFELIEEYTAWPRGRKDGLDALSQGLEVWDTGMQSTSDELDAYERQLQEMRNVATGY